MSIINQLIKHEGVRNKMYLDSEGIETIGVGHNLRDRPISDRAVLVIFEDDIEDTITDLSNNFRWFKELDEVRRGVLINMGFNMGINRLKGFVRMIAAIKAQNWQLAADELLDSEAARDLPTRYNELADQMRAGE